MSIRPIPRPSTRLGDESGPLWFGANFWSRAGGPLMWRRFDADVVREELRVLVRHGVELTRSFFFWPDFHPEPHRVDDTLVDRFSRFLDLHTELGMRTIPTFIVGHMSGENWDPPWRAGRDLYRDVWMVDRQAWFIREMTSRLHEHPAIAAWLISNEMPIYGGGGGPTADRSEGIGADDVAAWADLMVQAVRAGGGLQPVSIGDGAWGIETTGNDNGFRLRELVPLVDFVGPHTYPVSDDQARQHLFAAFVTELCALGRPVVMEEFGVTSDFSSDEAAGDYYRQTLHTTALAGATGWIAWNNTDFDLPDQDPYRHHPFEQHFGITNVQGTPKAPLHEMQRFRRFADEVDLAACSRPPTETSILVSSYLEVDYPFVESSDRRVLRDVLLQSYISARLADLAPALVREADSVPSSPLVIVPSTKALLAPTWRALEVAAAAGATVLVTYSCGDSPAHRGPWHPDFDRFFGVRRRLRYGLADAVTDDVLRWTLVQDVADLPAGTEFAFRVAGTADGRVFVPLDADDAEVLAVDAASRPALVCRTVDRGRILLATAPLEYFAARSPRVNPDDTVRLYDAVARLAGVHQLATAGDPHVLSDVLQHADGRRWAVFVSQADHPVRTAVGAAGGQLTDQSGAVVDTLELQPFDVAVLQLGTPHPAAMG